MIYLTFKAKFSYASHMVNSTYKIKLPKSDNNLLKLEISEANMLLNFTRKNKCTSINKIKQ